MPRLWGVMAVMGVVAAGGCVRMELRPALPVDGEGIPHRAYLVGDSREVEFEAPGEGVGYVVEETTRTVLERARLSEGQRVRPAEVEAEPETIERELGISYEDYQPWFYFVPDAAWPDGGMGEADE